MIRYLKQWWGVLVPIASGLIGSAPIAGMPAILAIGDAIQNLGLQIKSLIIAPNKTSEGRIVHSADRAWFEIIRVLSIDWHAAFQISSHRWEEIIAGAYKVSGFDEVILTPRSGDLGRDVIATKRGIGSIRVVDQVKAYNPSNLVTANDVRALCGIISPDGASKGFLTTTSSFAPGILTDPLLSKWMPNQLELIDGTALEKRLTELLAEKTN
jgi:restriction system protein